jgi:hypothetical protein
MLEKNLTEGKYLGAIAPTFRKSHCLVLTFLPLSKASGHATIGIGDVTELGLTNLAHRLLVEILTGRIGDTDAGEPIVVRHTCGNSSCLNYLHLQLGTRLENDLDEEFHKRAIPKELRLSNCARVKFIKKLPAFGMKYYRPLATAISTVKSVVRRAIRFFRKKSCYHSPLKDAPPRKLRRILYCMFFGPSTDFSHWEQDVETTCGDDSCINIYHFKRLGPSIPRMDALPHKNSTLTFGQIEAIKVSRLPASVLAEIHGVHKTTVERHRGGLEVGTLDCIRACIVAGLSEDLAG